MISLIYIYIYALGFIFQRRFNVAYFAVFRLGLWCLAQLTNNTSVISWRPVLLVEETDVPRENKRPAVGH